MNQHIKTSLGVIIILIIAITTGAFVWLSQKNNIVGNDKDEHGCVGSAGYSWCEEKQKCLRTWEENCGSSDVNDWQTYKNDRYGFEFKYLTKRLATDNNKFNLENKEDYILMFGRDTISGFFYRPYADISNPNATLSYIEKPIEAVKKEIEDRYCEMKDRGYKPIKFNFKTTTFMDKLSYQATDNTPSDQNSKVEAFNEKILIKLSEQQTLIISAVLVNGYFITGGQFVYSDIPISQQKKEFYQIISTFKFTN